MTEQRPVLPASSNSHHDKMKETKMKRINYLFAGVTLLFALPAFGAPATAEKIEVAKLPKVVADAINARFPGATLTSAEKETEGEKIVYDIELKHEGRKYEMDVKADGVVVEIEKEIAAKDLPESVSKSLEAKYPKVAIKEIMEVYKVTDKKEKLDHYEVVIDTADKQHLEVTASLDGKSIDVEDSGNG
jgi:uncharacterized membrane protein YkoI